ncbi:MAG: alanine--glyoxylate aminotransferase family protein [Campylobacteraceae bacterium]|jgi:aspartate aminotransferase-like enzyme|nr:alanine--glyoxylate aminotransferase family protein [Campylobacteraceae bacterium]
MLLFTPGPTPTPEVIRAAMSVPTIHHRTPEFEEIFKTVREKLIKIMNMPEVLMLASSGTGAMEAAVTNLCKSRALSINAGKFGERFGKICKAFDIACTELKYSWDTPASIEDILREIDKNPEIDVLCIQICESAGGLRHDVEGIAKAVKSINKDIMVIADGITAVGVEKIDTAHIDVLITGSQKAFMLPPGLAMIGLSGAAVKKIESAPRGFYFNLASELKSQRKNTTAYTAATTLIIGLRAMLELIEKEGFEKFYEDTKTRALSAKAALEAIGLKIYPKSPALAMNTVYHERAKEIRAVAKKRYGVNIAGGQDELKDKLFRINNMGLIAPYEIAWALNAVELALDELGERAYDGAANRVFVSKFFKGVK